MTFKTHNWLSSAHQELHKTVKDEIFPIVNQVDARVQKFEIQFLKEAAKFVGDFKSLVKEADESLAKYKALELEIERLLRAVVSQDIMSVNLENENVKLEFQVLNYAKENAHLKTTYKNLFDSISVTRTQTKTIIDSLQNKLHDTIYENAKLRAQLFDTVSDQKDTSRGTSANTKYAKQSILGKPPKAGETHALSKPVTSNSIPTPQGSKVVKNSKVIALRMFRITPFKPSREENHVPNKVRASIRTNSITVSQPPVITKKVVNSDSNGLSSTGVDNTKIRRPQPRSNTKNDRVPSASKSSRSKNKEFDVEEHHRKLLLFRNRKHMLFECNNVKLATQNVKSKVVCAMLSKGVKNAKVIAPGMFRVSLDKIFREAKKVPNTISVSSRTKPITVSQPSVITKKDMNSDLNGLSSTGLDNTKTRRPQPRSNTKNYRSPLCLRVVGASIKKLK
nr:hypothetical protein [Tanacetum cinerariifolium]